MTRTILSLWLPRLSTDRLARHDGQGAPPTSGTPLSPEPLAGCVTVAAIRNAQRLVAVDKRAEAAGLRAGMALADARAIAPGLGAYPAEPLRDAAWLDDIAAWCGRFTPLVALDGRDGLVLDITGATHLFGGVAATARAVEDGLRALGIEARTAVAGTPEAAWALARFGDGTQAGAAPADPRALRGRLQALPLAALQLDPDTVRALAQAGLRQVADLLCRPRAPLVARFGPTLLERLDGLMGENRHPISPRVTAPLFVVEQRFASPITLEDDIARTLEALAHRLCAVMERHARGARHIEARLFRVDGAVKRLEVGTSRPLVRPADILRLVRDRIAALREDGLDTGYGFDLVRLGALVTEPVAGEQTDMLGPGHTGDADDLAAVVDRLGARLGTRTVTRLAHHDTHIPEDAAPVAPALEARTAKAREGAGPFPGPPIEGAPVRPIRLFARPEPIDTMAAVPDGPPVRFTWRRATHVVAAIEGPERIAPEWWRPTGPGLTRDYFRAEDHEGRQFWLFREGLFTTETAAPRWFVHGLFG